MTLVDFIQNLLSSGALVLGFTYIIGGLIVNLNLARRGVTEYQIVKIKYLVVGIVFLLNSAGTFVLAAIPAFFLLMVAGHILVQILGIISTSASISLLIAWARFPQDTNSWLSKRWYWFLASTIGAIFPMMILIRQILLFQVDVHSIALLIEAVMVGVLVFVAQIYHYSAFYYGRGSGFLETLDPIGIGIPRPVKLACDPGEMTLLAELGLPFFQSNIIGDVFLVDETDKYYILALERVGGKTFVVSKEMIKAILYSPDNIQSSIDRSEEKQKAAQPAD